MKDLAIVIPAYKPTFFRHTLDSIASQTDKRFTLYIGDDCSPYNILDIVSDYKEKIDIVYHRFETNVGGTDLVQQWERCIALAKKEHWIWLFSDDDEMGTNCVANFYNQIKNENKHFDIYHLNVDVIDEKGNIIKKSVHYPSVIQATEFYKRKAMSSIESFVVENIFSRDIYNSVNGFAYFPIAWGSDVLTWIFMMKKKGMKTINGDVVRWRYSHVNITPDRSRKTSIIKINADIDLLQRTNSYFGPSIHFFNKMYLSRLLFNYATDLGLENIYHAIHTANSQKVIQVPTTVVLLIASPAILFLKFLRNKLKSK